MLFCARTFLPAESEFSTYFSEMRRYAAIARRILPDRVLENFFEFPMSAREHHIAEVHHVAFYVGDYQRDVDVEYWIAFLAGNHLTSELTFGPSYIAPREYGTQGYWINCSLEGIPVEMFANKHEGPWRYQEQIYKSKRMSHFALSVPQAYHLNPLLTYFSHYQDISILSYSPQDALGHTYGHLLNRKTNCVMELTYSDAPQAAREGHNGNIVALTLGAFHG